MTKDSLKINKNEDGSFTAEWDKKDPDWSWLNNLTSKVNLGDSLNGSTILSKNLNDITVNTVLNKISELENNL